MANKCFTGLTESLLSGQSDVVLSNSRFTSRVYARAFPTLAKRPPKVVYPCIDVDAYQFKGSKGKAKAKDRGEGVNLIASYVHLVNNSGS